MLTVQIPTVGNIQFNNKHLKLRLKLTNKMPNRTGLIKIAKINISKPKIPKWSKIGRVSRNENLWHKPDMGPNLKTKILVWDPSGPAWSNIEMKICGANPTLVQL